MLIQADKMQFDRLVNTFSSSVSKFQDVQQVSYLLVRPCVCVCVTICIYHTQRTSDLERELLSKARTVSISRSVRCYYLLHYVQLKVQAYCVHNNYDDSPSFRMVS